MDNLPRFSFYLSGILIVSAAFTLFTNDFLPLIADPGFKGTAFLIAFGLVYMNIVFVVSRRFMRRLEGPSKIPYVFALTVALAPIIWSFVYDAGLFGSIKTMYLFTVVFACALGGYFGERAGIKAQVKFKQQLYEYLKKTGQLPDDLKRAHEHLNKN